MNRLRIRNHWLSESRGGGGHFRGFRVQTTWTARPHLSQRGPSCVRPGIPWMAFSRLLERARVPARSAERVPKKPTSHPIPQPPLCRDARPGGGAQRRLPSYLVLCSVKPRTG